MGREVDLVDDQEVGAGDAGAALGRDLVAGRDVDDVDGEVGELREKVAARLSPPDSISTRSSPGNFARMSATAARFIEASSRIAVCGQPPVSTPAMRSGVSEPERTRNSASHLV